ncbi:MAG: glycerol-3-phosphate dehydrogenase/oxidase [Verrucomicrobiota bacterium]
MNREHFLKKAEDRDVLWDIVVIGGGATGLGAAVDAMSRGYQTLLLEQDDFAKGTSSRSTKLIHGGVRYLRQGNVALVAEGLRERGLLLRNAPHLVHDRPFVVPTYNRWQGALYATGLKVYDALAGRLSMGSSRFLSRAQTSEAIPNLAAQDLRGGVLYHDAQFDDARLAISLVQTLAEGGGTPLNYMKVSELLKRSGRISGVRAIDIETCRAYEIRARAVINATGAFGGEIMQMDASAATPLLTLSQGIHLVLDRDFLGGDAALMVPRTDDGRVLFAIPWLEKVVLGTTDTPVTGASLEPQPLPGEVDFLLAHAGRYLTRVPGRADVRAVFAGLRPLLKPPSARRTAAIARDYAVTISPSGLVTVTGGKWTIYRRMGEAAINAAVDVGRLERRPSSTAVSRLHGWIDSVDRADPLSVYGSDGPAIRDWIKARPDFGQLLHPRLPYLKAQVVWGARHELARTVEDILARRTRCLFLDARASMEAAPAVAELLGPELGRDTAWQQAQVRAFSALARRYQLQAS